MTEMSPDQRRELPKGSASEEHCWSLLRHAAILPAPLIMQFTLPVIVIIMFFVK